MWQMTKETLLNILLFLWICFLLIVTLARNYFGIEITDEAFYVAEAISVLRGNVPYAYTMGRATGFTFVMLPFIKLYSILIPDLEGLFLYTRMCSSLFRIAIIFCSYFLLHKYYNKRYLIFILSLLIPASGVSIPNFNYNMISIWLLYFTGVIQLSSIKSKNEKKLILGAISSGILVALSEMAHPAQLLNVFWFGITYLLCIQEKKWKFFLIYTISGFTILFLVLGIIIIQVGGNKLIFGIETILKYTNAYPSPITVNEHIKEMFDFFKPTITIFVIGIIFSLFLNFIIKTLLLKISHNTNGYNVIKMIVNIKPEDIFLLTISLASIRIFQEESEITSFYHLGAIGAILLILCWGESFRRKNKEFKTIVFTLMVYPISQFIITGFFTYSHAYSRICPFIYSVWGIAVLLENYFLKERFIRKALNIFSISSVFLLLLYYNYNYVYRDAPIYMLDTKIEQGIYKNLYTSVHHAENIVQLENYIKNSLSADDKVLFMDLAPMGYIMSEAIPWTPSTWDRLQYSYGFNNPEIIYRYFESKGDIPDKIIYIDFGRDNMLSIETNTYLFNKFVNENYCLDEDKILNDGFRVKKYVRIIKTE